MFYVYNIKQITLITIHSFHTLFYFIHIIALKMSARLSRSEQFYEAFERFIAPTFVLTGQLDIWNLDLLTENTRKNTHKYNLCLPYNRMVYSLDTQVTLADGTKQGPGAVYVPQNRPSMGEFWQAFGEYFERYELVRNEKLLSIVYIHSTTENEKNDINIEIIVKYHKQYQPYPVETPSSHEMEIMLQRLEARAIRAEEECAIAVDHYQNIQYDLEDTKILFHEYRERQDAKFNKLEAVFRKFAMDAYAKEEELKDCPVCFDPMTKDTVHITLCAHYICKSCNSMCSNCPLCRQRY